jgi:choline dehydrogenase-like flavoprotein
MPPPAPRCAERLLQRAAGSVGIPVVPIRRAVMTRPHRGFPACHLCGSCGKGCDTASFFNSADHLLPSALETGRLEIRSTRCARRGGRRGLAKGVQYFDRRTGAERLALGKVVVMAASCMDSTRILLNSRSERYPNGIGNGADVIGRYLCEQIRFHVRGFLPELYDGPFQNSLGIGGEHVYLPRFNHRPEHKRGYLRGFGSQFWSTGCLPTGASHVAFGLPGFGVSLKKAIRRRYPAWFEMHPYGEVLPYAHNRITVGDAGEDRYGVPVVKIDYRIGDNELKMAEHMSTAAARSAGRPEPSLSISKDSTRRPKAHRPDAPLANRNRARVECSWWMARRSRPREKNPTLTILAPSWRLDTAEIKRGSQAAPESRARAG